MQDTIRIKYLRTELNLIIYRNQLNCDGNGCFKLKIPILNWYRFEINLSSKCDESKSAEALL